MNIHHIRPVLLVVLLLTSLPVSARATADNEGTPEPIIADDMEMTLEMTRITVKPGQGRVPGFCVNANYITFEAQLIVEWLGEDSWLGQSFDLNRLEAVSLDPDGSEHGSSSSVQLQDKPSIADDFSLDEDKPTTARIWWAFFLEPEHLERGIEIRLYYGSDLRYDLETDSYYNIEAAWQGKFPAEVITEVASEVEFCRDDIN